MSREPLSTERAAAAVGITRITLQRWIAAGKVHAPRPTLRGAVGVRMWSPADVERLRNEKQRIYRKGRGRKPKRKR